MSKLLTMLLVVVMCGVGACRRSPAATPSHPLDGTWTGSLSPDGGAAGQLAVTLRQAAAGVSGEWTATFSDPSSNRAGSVSGTVTGTVVALFLTPQVGLNCGGVPMSGTLGVSAVLDADRIAGRYTVLTCTGTSGGAIDVRR